MEGRHIARQVIDAASDAFIGIDRTGLITDWNPAAERTFGYSAEEAIGEELADTIIPEGLREAHRAGSRASCRRASRGSWASASS